LLLFFQCSMSADKAMGMNPSEESPFTLFRPKFFGPPPFKNVLTSLG
jgi:hypothetical protein